MLQESQPSVLLWIVAETGRETRWICGWLSNLKKIIFPLALPQHCWNVLFTHVKRRLWGHSFSQSLFYSAGAELKNWITFKSVEWLFGPHTHTHFFLLFFIQDSDRKAAPLFTEARVLWETSQLAFEILFPGSGRALQKAPWPTHIQTTQTLEESSPAPAYCRTRGWAFNFWTLAKNK